MLKKKSILKFYTRWKYPSKVKAKKGHFQTKTVRNHHGHLPSEHLHEVLQGEGESF